MIQFTKQQRKHMSFIGERFLHLFGKNLDKNEKLFDEKVIRDKDLKTHNVGTSKLKPINEEPEWSSSKISPNPWNTHFSD